MRRKLVAGNWKMHGRRTANAALIDVIRRHEGSFRAVDVWLGPPSVYLEQVFGLIAGGTLELLGQNAASEPDGACTGEVSAGMLADVGCRAVLVGHSERRSRYGETDAVVAEKFGRIREAGLIPVLCVGETLAERESGQAEAVVLRQLAAVVDQMGVSALDVAVLAYEPVWAIGTGHTASPEQAQQMHAVLRAAVAEKDAALAAGLRILYGGSVKSTNAAALFAMPDIDGALVGGASLNANDFVEIIRSAGADE